MSRLRGPALNYAANYALALLSAALLILICPDWNVVWLAPLALTPLLWALAREPRPLHRFLLGYAAGWVYWFTICIWIQFVLEYHGGMGQWGGWGTFLLFCAYKSIHLGVFSLLAAILLPHWYAAPAIAALWTGIERTHGNFGFAWLALGNAGIDMPVPLRLAPVTGVYGLSFVFALLGTAFALALLKRPRKQFPWVAPVLLLPLLPALPEAPAAGETAVLVQPNVPEDREWAPVTTEQLHLRLASVSLEAARRATTRLVLWPEVPGPLYYYNDPSFHEKVTDLARLAHAYFLFGTVAQTPDHRPLNSAVMLKPDGSFVDRYDKINLVPFGEFVPEPFGFVNRISKEAGDFVPGNRMVLFPVQGQPVGAFICYESVFPDHVRQFVKRGATLLVNLSNDGYFGHSAARGQHLSIVRMRAAENERWILRATNDGISAAIDPAGRVTSRILPYSEQVARVDFGYNRALTPYSLYGDWFAWGCLLMAVALLPLTQWPHYTPPRKPGTTSAGSQARRRP